MKKASVFTFAAIATFGVACAQSLYYVGDEAQESLPLKWSVGVNAVYDSNTNPGVAKGNVGYDDDAWSINPYVGVSVTTITPQTTIDLYARAGVNYYLTEADLSGSDDTTGNARVGFDLTHRFSERVRFSSRNFIAYEMEPEYSYGLSNQRGIDPYTYWSTDNSIGYRWTERVASYTGLAFTSYSGDNNGSDRDSWSFYHQMRYQLSPRTVLTAQYRYSEWSGDASDSQNHYITGGFEHRLSATSILVASAGVQLRDVDGGESTSSPYLEAAVSSQINSRFSVRGFARYGIEDYDTVRLVGITAFEYSDQRVMRLGVNGDYALTPRLSAFGGLDYITTAFDEGLEVGGPAVNNGQSEDILNLYVGLRAKFNDQLTGECSINYTDSSSDFDGRDYDRLRLSAGVSYSF